MDHLIGVERVSRRYPLDHSFVTEVSDAMSATVSFWQSRVRAAAKETYFGVTAGDFDFSAGKRLLRCGTGYAFTATGILDPPRNPTDPMDRLNLNEGREMFKADWIHAGQDVTVFLRAASGARPRPCVITFSSPALTRLSSWRTIAAGPILWARISRGCSAIASSCMANSSGAIRRRLSLASTRQRSASQ